MILVAVATESGSVHAIADSHYEMANLCKICTDPRREEIDAALLGPATFRNVAKRFDISASSCTRHTSKHLQQQLALQEPLRAEHALSLIGRLTELVAEIQNIKETARIKGSDSLRLRCVESEVTIIERLSDRLGITSQVTRSLSEAEGLAKAVAQVRVEHPELAQALSVELSRQGFREMAMALSVPKPTLVMHERQAM